VALDGYTVILASDVTVVTPSAIVGYSAGNYTDLAYLLHPLSHGVWFKVGEWQLKQELDSTLEQHERVAKGFSLVCISTFFACGIGHRPVCHYRLPGKYRACLPSIIAYRDYQVPRFAAEALETTRLVSPPGYAGFSENLDCKGVYSRHGLGSGTLSGKFAQSALVQECFGDLTSCRVAGAEKQYPEWATRTSPHCDFPLRELSA
jgi:hypothetical protein